MDRHGSWPAARPCVLLCQAMGGVRQHTIALELAWPFARAMRRRGLEVRALIEGREVSISEAEAASPWLRVQWDVMVESLTRSEAAFGPGLGVHAALVARPTDFGDLMRLAQAQPTLGECVAAHDRFYRLMTTAAIIESVPQIGGVVRRLHAAPGVELSPTMIEFIFGLWMVLARYLTGRPSLTIAQVSFRHAAPADLDVHRTLFNCPLRFGASEDAMRITSATLALPSAHADPFEAEVFESRLQQLERDLPAQTARQWVEEQVLLQLSEGPPAADKIARRFGTSTRHLHRLLHEEGTSYRGVVDELRKRLALEYLERSELSVAEVAQRLGFANTHTFHRAFRRLTGTTPSVVRKRASA